MPVPRKPTIARRDDEQTRRRVSELLNGVTTADGSWIIGHYCAFEERLWTVPTRFRPDYLDRTESRRRACWLAWADELIARWLVNHQPFTRPWAFWRYAEGRLTSETDEAYLRRHPELLTEAEKGGTYACST